MTRLIPFALLILALLPASVSAEIVLPDVENALSVTITPLHPKAGERVRLEAHSAILDLSRSALTWELDGAPLPSGVGVIAADIVAGALGEEKDVIVRALAEDGTAASARSAIIPTGVDVLFDSDSYVPPFYRGRALPSAGTNVRLEAIPFFTEGKKLIPADELTYTWKKNGVVLGALSGRGKSSAIIPAAHLFGSDTVSVEVTTDDQALSGEASAVIPAHGALLMLYEDHPLYGIRFGQALSGANLIADAEMTFAAIPYFASARSPRDPVLSWAWNVNETDVRPGAAHPNELTVSGKGSSGGALISLELTHASNFLLDAKGAWQVTLGAGVQDAFRVAQ